MTDTHQGPDFLRLVFTTSLGTTKSIEIDYDSFREVASNGYYFDGSSVPGYAVVNSSDLLLKPTSSLPLVQPWDPSVAVLLCAVHEVSGEPHPSDPRLILRRVLGEASDEGYHLEVGSELEFFLVTREAANGIAPIDRGGYFDVLPSDGGLDFRRRVVRTLRRMGIATTAHHHEAAEGQHEICLRHGPAVRIPDSVMLSKLAIAELAHQEGMIATFMPKPFVGCNGSGMHLHQSLWDIDVDKNLFATDDAGALSDIAGHYVAGLLTHAGALAAIVAPTINSYKRLTPGFEAPTRIAWGPRNRSTMIRVPQFNGSSMKARIEFRCPDPSCNPHLAIAAILAAGLDGVRRSLEPPSPTDEDLFESETEVASLPASLIHALGELNKDSTLRRALGDRVVDTIVDVRTKEWSEYLDATGDPGPSHITGWEMERYLLAS